MSASMRVKAAFASFLQSAGIFDWKLRRCSTANIAVLMYHRILPRKEMSAGVQPGMVVEPDTLDLHLRYLRRYFKLIPLSDLASMRQDVTRGRLEKPRCVLTFDDGWYDFYEFAYPILKMHEAPATVFLPTNFIGTGRWFWTDRLALLISRMERRVSGNSMLSVNPGSLLNDILSLQGGSEERLERAIALLKPHRVEEIESVITQLSDVLGEEAAPADRAFLSWNEVREMFDSGLISFGSHTADHLLLTTVSKEQARFELKKSMADLITQRVVDSNFVTFSYPNGNFSAQLSEIVREEGYRLAVTTQAGWHDEAKNPFMIQRIAIHEDIASTEAMLSLRIVSSL